jgi:hypothetical protein
MGRIFNLYRGGYRQGVADGLAGRRHKADWELWLFKPVNWLPGVDAGSFAAGYAAGYGDGSRITFWQQQQQQHQQQQQLLPPR